MSPKPSFTPRATPRVITKPKKAIPKKATEDIFAAHYLRSAYIWSFAKR